LHGVHDAAQNAERSNVRRILFAYRDAQPSLQILDLGALIEARLDGLPEPSSSWPKKERAGRKVPRRAPLSADA